MSEAKKDVKFSLKVMVNKQKMKVLFAQVDSSFADVWLSLLTLPLGTIVRILKKHYVDEAAAFGSVSSLYDSLENLDSVHFWTEGAKKILLHPRSSSDAQCKTLKLDIGDSQPFEDFICDCCYSYGHEGPPRFRSESMYYDNAKCQYHRTTAPMTKKLAKDNAQAADDGVFMVSSSSFVITDDMQMLSTTTGLLKIATSLGTTDMDKADQMNVTFGFAEVMDLLKASLISSTPLSDIILDKTGVMKSTERKLQQGISLSDESENASASNSKKMILRVMVQKSTNKLLYAQAEEDFVELLFSFLVIPLGGVESLLVGNSLNKYMDILYSSLADHIEDKYFKSPDSKSRLINPKIPHGYISKNHILPLIEEELTSQYKDINFFSSSKFPKGQGKYLKAPTTFMVTDDLTVTPLCIPSTVSFLQQMKVTVSDVKEVELQIGLKEALGILRASLVSTSALTDGLNLTNTISQKQVKQEH